MRVGMGLDCWRREGGREHPIAENFVKNLAFVLQAAGCR